MTRSPCPTTSGPYRCASSGEHTECETTAPEYAIGRHAGVERRPDGDALAAIARLRVVALRDAGQGGELEAQVLADCDALARAMGQRRSGE